MCDECVSLLTAGFLFKRIHNLTSYLQALHEEKQANADHTTLLLNCYTKLKDNEKLNEFIRVRHKKRKTSQSCFTDMEQFPLTFLANHSPYRTLT
jgi:hypothetical protein